MNPTSQDVDVVGTHCIAPPKWLAQSTSLLDRREIERVDDAPCGPKIVEVLADRVDPTGRERCKCDEFSDSLSL